MVVASVSARKQFDRDGFVVIENVFDLVTLGNFSAAVDIGVNARLAGDSRTVADKSEYERNFIQCMNLWEDNPDIRAFTFHQELAELAASLLGAERLRLWSDQALYKESGGTPTPQHQDFPLWPIDRPRQITAWIPFDGSTFDGGAMGYSPGSHKKGIVSFDNDSRNIRPAAHKDDPAFPLIAHTEMAEPVWVQLQPGSVAFHHSMTLHQAQANSSGRTRRVFTVAYFEDGCKRSTSHNHQVVDRQETVIGQTIDGPVTPMAWPLPEGQLPDTPLNATPPPRTGYQ